MRHLSKRVAKALSDALEAIDIPPPGPEARAKYSRSVVEHALLALGYIPTVASFLATRHQDSPPREALAEAIHPTRTNP